MTEEQQKQCEEVINSYEEKYNEWLKGIDKKIFICILYIIFILIYNFY